ncbi:unnamed protein product [Ostreobium quekettii]|uniref:TPX2 C-terminal domain-containing protein n=1 Tax=Ostreobium quekettii TaxID=121088 RepID=A0A8S1J6Y9_9CHLO|nr:unnamed protein product [Ostreobium quekettii]
MAAEELRAWRTKLDEQKAVGARWIARGREQLKDILNTLEMEKAAIAERRRAAEAKMVDVERSKVPPCLQEDVEQLKKMSSALEAEVPAKKANVKKLNACVEEMTARLARKKKILRQYLEQVKKLKTQQKLANRFSATPKESWVGPTPPFYIDRHKSGRQNQGLVYGSVTVADDENGQPHTEKVLKRPGIVPILYYCDGVPLMSTGGGTPPIKSYLLHTIREESGPREDSAEADKSPCVGEEEGANGKHAEHKDCMEPESLPCPSTRGAAGSPSTPRCTITSAARTATTAKRIQSPKSGDAQESAKARPSAKRSKTSTSGGKVFWTDYRAWRQENECKPYLQEQTWLKEMSRRAEQEMKEAQEERKWRRWRREHQFMAQPMPQFREPVLECHSDKQPTVPAAPKLWADERARTRKFPTQEASAVYAKLRKQYIARTRQSKPKTGIE